MRNKIFKHSSHVRLIKAFSLIKKKKKKLYKKPNSSQKVASLFGIRVKGISYMITVINSLRL